MKFRNALLVTVLSVATLAMLLRVVHSVNHLGSEQVVSPGLVHVADGAPFPPLPPGTASLVADGAPFPPFPPGTASLVAMGHRFDRYQL
jgi:hypothetical protein